MMFSWKERVRSWLKPTTRQVRSRTKKLLGLESLEIRDTPSITVSGAATNWSAVGPTGITGALNVQIGTASQNVEEGAVNGVAVDPNNPAHVVIGAVNGGIWSTTNINAPTVSWTTSTDNLPSLAISTVEFSPTLPNVVYAGTGSYTNGGLTPNYAAQVNQEGDGGGAVGLYKSTDGGLTWTTLPGNTTFEPLSATTAGLRINSLLPTSLNNGQTIFASTADNSQTVTGGLSTTGLYESDDGGNTWTQLSGNAASGLPLLPVTSVIADPGDPNRFYAAVLGNGGGVYMLDVTGGNKTWVNISSNLPTGVISGADRVVLAASAAGVDPVYAAVVGPVSYGAGDGLIGVYRAVPFSPPVPAGQTPSTTYVWTAIGQGGLPPDILPGGQGQTNLGLIADPSSDSIVYVAGDRTTAFVGQFKGGGFPGSMARGDAIADTWTTVTEEPNPNVAPDPGTTIPLDPGPQPTTAPHSDFRALVFDGTSKILAVSDGGIYSLTNPQAKPAAPVWASLNGDLQTTEFYSVAIANNGSTSSKNTVLYGASQDNGVESSAAGAAWSEISSGGDGTLTLADNTNNYVYYGTDYLFQFYRKNPNGSITDLSTSPITGTGLTLSGNTTFTPAAVLNQANPNEMLINGPGQTDAILLSTNNGNSFTSIGGLNGGIPANVPNVGTANSTITAMAFGTSQITNAAYVATDDGNIAQSFDVTVNNGNFTMTNFQSVAGGAPATAIAMDPTNPLIAYAVTSNGVYLTTNGETWTNITGNLLGLVAKGELTNLYSLSLFTDHSLTNSIGDYLLVGGLGGVYKLPVADAIQGTTGWSKFGSGIPNVVVSSLFYDSQTDTLLAGTYGRGAFELTGVTAALTTTSVVVNVVGGVGSNSIAIYPNPTNTSQYIVSDGLGNQETFTTAGYPTVSISLANGATTAYIGASGPTGTTPAPAGELTTPLGVHIKVTGTGASSNTLVVNDSADAVPQSLTVVPQTGSTPGTIGGGGSDTLLGVGGSLSFTGFNAGQIQFLLGSAGDTVNLDDETTSTGASVTAATSYTVTSAGVTRSTGGNFTFNQLSQLNLTGTNGAGTYNIQSTASNLAVTGGSGTNTFNVAGDAPANTDPLGALGGSLAFTGGTGSNTLNVNGVTANESITGTLTNVNGTGSLSGLPEPLNFTDVTNVSYNGLTGTNGFSFLDSTGGAYGTAINPTSGLVFIPATSTSGSIDLDGFTMSIAAINGGLSLNGDGNAAGTKDTLLVLGTSGPGLSQYGEPVIGDGRDQLTISDSQVSITSYSAGALLSPTLATNSGATSFATLYVETGVTSDTLPDQVTVTPSTLLNLVVDGSNGGTANGAQATVAGIGPFTSSQTTDPSYGPAQTRVTDVGTAGQVGLIGFSNTSFTGPGLQGGSMSSGIVAVATQAGPLGTVQVYDKVTGDLRFTIVPFPGFHGGLSVATGDVVGSGYDDLVVGAGAGGGPLVEVFSGIDGTPLGQFYAYATSFRGGVNVSVAQTPGVGHADIYTGTGPGGGPQVEQFDGQTYAQIRSAFVYESTFRGGVQVAVGDVNGDGVPDLVTSTGAGGGPQVQVLNGTNLRPIASFYAFGSNTRSGFSVAVANVTGGGPDSIIVGSGAGLPAEIKVFTGLGSSVYTDFYLNSPLGTAQAPTNAGDNGVQVSAADINGDGIPDILAVGGSGSTPLLHAYQVAALIPPTNAVTPVLTEIKTEPVMGGSVYTGLTVAGDGS